MIILVRIFFVYSDKDSFRILKSLLAIIWNVSWWLSPVKYGTPWISSSKIMPKAQTSTALVYFSLRICSGAIYYLVPAIVSMSILLVERPKSASLTWNPLSLSNYWTNNIFSGFKSLWVIPWLCKTWTALAVSRTISTAYI